MRQIVLVVVLVGAAFLGGAFVNGPGLRWVQTQVLGSMGMDGGGEIATVDLKGGAGGDRVGPVAPVPGLAGEPAAKDRDSADAGRSEHRQNPAEALAPSVAASAASPPSTMPELAGPADPPSEAVGGPDRASRDPDVTRAAGSPSSSSSPPPSPPSLPAEGDPGRPTLMDSGPPAMPGPAPVRPDSPAPTAPMPDPAPSPASPSPSPSPAPAPTPGRAGDEDWAVLARKMQTLGITRYTIEGQPGGRVVFSCLIPLAGRQAVAQRFEAEADDAVQAARAALRRVALWRATQSPQPR